MESHVKTQHSQHHTRNFTQNLRQSISQKLPIFVYHRVSVKENASRDLSL